MENKTKGLVLIAGAIGWQEFHLSCLMKHLTPSKEVYTTNNYSLTI